MQDKEPIMAVSCRLKVPSFRITVRNHLTGPLMPNSYPGDGIFNAHLITIKDSYNL